MSHQSHPEDFALTPAKVLFRPSAPRYQDENRLWQGIPSMAKAPGGTLYNLFYSGMRGEKAGNYVVVARSDDDGQSWRCPEMVIDHPDFRMRCFDPCVWKDPLGRIWITWTQSHGFFDGRDGVWAIVSENPDDADPVWSPPRRIANGLMMNKPTVLRDGSWLFPCAVWKYCQPAGVVEHPVVMEQERFSNVYASTDNGENFVLRGGADVPDRCFDEHMTVERKDGRLWMLVRTLNTGWEQADQPKNAPPRRVSNGIGQSFSDDGGFTWSPGEPAELSGPCSRFFITRLRSGNLLLVNHYDYTGRNNLAARISRDDGRSWEGLFLIDGRDNVSYPDGFQDDSGLIYVTYDHDRYGDRAILMAAFTEEDILAGRAVSGRVRRFVLVSRATGKE